MMPIYSTVLLRFGEIGIKSKQTRRRMTSLLVKHVRTALKGNGVAFTKVRKEYGRIFIETEEAAEAAKAASKVFGIVSASPVVVVSSDMDTILATGGAMAKEQFAKGSTFAVDARRLGTHDYTSQDIRAKLGERILEGLPELNLKVNLTAPEESIYVEVRDDTAYLFTETVKGVGGMPTGSQGKAICTISGGLDSPVASYKVMKRGCIPVFAHFDNDPYLDNSPKEVAIKQARKLAEYIHDYEVKMYIVPHGLDLAQVVQHAPEKMICIYCKRNMLRLAREIAIIENADVIVTGEIIGEQASQTSKNLRAINTAVCDYPILRPCAGDDKVDIEHLAAEIGTYHLAGEVSSCCTLPPKYPEVKASVKEVESIEKAFDLKVILEQVSRAEIIVLKPGKPYR